MLPAAFECVFHVACLSCVAALSGFETETPVTPETSETLGAKMEGEEDEFADGSAMQLARRLCDRIHDAGDAPSVQLMTSLRMDLERLRVLVQAQVRQSAFQQMRHRMERDLLVCESQSDQVDREANSARIADRQRFLFERQQAQSGQAAAAERAAASAAYVESALCSLCPYVTQTSSGSAQLAK